MKGNHYILVAGLSFDRNTAGVIGVEFAQWLSSDEEQAGRFLQGRVLAGLVAVVARLVALVLAAWVLST